jgi:hypothetical protein
VSFEHLLISTEKYENVSLEEIPSIDGTFYFHYSSERQYEASTKLSDA